MEHSNIIANDFDASLNAFELEVAPDVFRSDEVSKFIADFGLVVVEVAKDSSVPHSDTDDYIFGLLGRVSSVCLLPIGGVRLAYSAPCCVGLVRNSLF